MQIPLNTSKTGEVEKAESLEKLIHHHNIKYFIDNAPEISDEKFDALVERLRKLNPDSPILYELVGDIGDVIHQTPMLSIDKKFSHKAIVKWVQDSGTNKFLIQPKYDGMRARYQNKVLATRGNGQQGEDITHRFNQLNVKGTLPKDKKTPVDGEIIIPLAYFNENLSDTYKNPRNAAVGIIKSKKIKEAGIQALCDGGIHFVLHDSAYSTEVSADQLTDPAGWETLLEQKVRIDYPLDGVVIKVKDAKRRVKLGKTQHHYKWEIAYKVPAERKWSEVVDIKDQVGRTGRITSVAVIKPIQLSGATVTNVTLHNHEYMVESGIGIGSKVEVTRSGEVIPFITKVKKGKTKPYKVKNKCPVCKQKLNLNGKFLECINKKCPSRLTQSYEYFFKVLNVEEMGGKTIERFINEFPIDEITDFYDLTKKQIAPLDGFGKKSAQNIVENIAATLKETVTPYQLLQALGIKEIGPATSRWIIDKYGFEKLPRLTEDDLKNVEGMGPIKAKYFVNEIKNKWWVINDLRKRGLKLKREKKGSPLKGLSFAITGTFENYTRNDLIKLIEQNGGKYKTSVTKDLDYLIVGENGGSKMKKAKTLEIKLIQVDKFLEINL